MENKLIKLSNEIVFVTSNKGKISSAQERFTDIKLTPYNYDLIEPRTDDIKEIAHAKIMQAYEVVKKPCIALDAGFFIEKLNDFPRAYVNFALETIGINGILKLMENIDNRKCAFRECLAYYDGEEILYFDGNHEGELSYEVMGNDNENKWSDLWYIFKPYGFNKTLAEMSDYERNSRPICKEHISSFDRFFEYHEKTKILK